MWLNDLNGHLIQQLVNRRITTTIFVTQLINIVSIWGGAGFSFLPSNLFGRILIFYKRKYVYFLGYLTFTYINMYTLVLLYKTI
jgi:hypothetical protein